MKERLEHFYVTFLRRRWLALVSVLVLTGALGALAGKVKPDHSIEMLFPVHDQSRIDYERFKKDFPFEDAQALVVVGAPDLYTPTGLSRIAALEADLAAIPGVIDTQGLTTVNDLVSDGDVLRMDRLFPSPDMAAEELAAAKKTATSDPIFKWTLASPDGAATSIRVTLSTEHARQEEFRTAFMKAAREVLAKHDAAAREAGVAQKLTLNGLPIIRSEFTEMIGKDLGVLFPLALLVILVILGLTFRTVADVGAALVTILFAVVWTTGIMGLFGVPLQVLTQMTPIIVLIVSISDTVHIVAHSRELGGEGKDKLTAIAHATADSFIPCLLTEITIAGGFFALMLNDMVMIQQFGLVTAFGMLLTWLANVTVLPLMLMWFRKKPVHIRRSSTPVTRKLERFVGWIEHVVTTRPRAVFLAAGVITVTAIGLGTQAGRQYYNYDDLRPESQLAKNLRYVEKVHGGTVPLAVYIEPKGSGPRKPDAMLEPDALRLIDKVGQTLENEYGDDVKNAASLAKVMRKAHRLLAGEEMAAEDPLPATRRLAAQELLAVDDPRALRDILSFDRSAAAVFTMVPDLGSAHATKVLRELEQKFAAASKDTNYTITITGIYGLADGIYRSMVGGLAASLGVAIALSFLVFCLVLRSWRLALIALVPNVLPLILTLALMSLLGIDVKPTTIIVFSITLVIADDDTIQYLARFRARFFELKRAGSHDAHREAALATLRGSGLPMFITAAAVTTGFLSLLFSQFLGLANLGLLIGVSLTCAVFADLFLTPLLIMTLKPRL